MLVVIIHREPMTRIKHQLKRPWRINAETGNGATKNEVKRVLLPIEVLLIVVYLSPRGIAKVLTTFD